MVHALKTVGAKHVICTRKNFKVVRAAARKSGISEHGMFLLEETMDGVKSMKDLVEEGRQKGEEKQATPWAIPQGKKYN